MCYNSRMKMTSRRQFLSAAAVVVSCMGTMSAHADAAELIPQPQKASVSWRTRTVADKSLKVRISVEKEDAAAAAWAKAHLKAWFGAELQVNAATVKREAPYGEEKYRLSAGPKGVEIEAKGLKGVRYALFTLRQAALRERGVAVARRFILPETEVEDEPALGFRGVHLCWFMETNPKRIEMLIRLAALYKFNVVVLEPWGVWHSERNPWYGWKEGPMTRHEIARLRSIADDLGVTLVPQINVFGHAGACRSLTGKHAVLDFAPERAPLFEPRNGWNWCLSNPETRKALVELVTEILEQFGKPPYMHLGCDEANPPSCPDCVAAPSYAKLVCDHVAALCETVKGLGARPLVWHDMLLLRGDPRWKGFYANGSAETVKLVERLPKETVICDWYYGRPPKENPGYPSLRHFKSQGFDVLTCPWFTETGLAAQGLAAKEYGLKGLLVTTWNRASGGPLENEFVLGAAASWRADGTKGVDRNVFFDHVRLVGEDMHLADPRDTGIYDYQVPSGATLEDGWTGREFPEWAR